MSFMQMTRKWWIKEITPPPYVPHTIESIFPRDMGEFRYYPRATDWGSYFGSIMYKNKMLEQNFIQFYSDYENKNRMIYRLFVDVDRIDTWEDMKLFLFTFWNNIEVFYSGSKGFHVYVYIELANIDDMIDIKNGEKNRRRLANVLSTWCQTKIDSVTLVDIRRMCRIAFTKHPTTKRWKIPVDYTLSIGQIKTMAETPERYVDKFEQLYNKPIIPIKSWETFLLNPKDYLLGKL